MTTRIELTKNQLTRHALASEAGRYNLSCASVESDGVVQTDGRRLVFIKHAPDQQGPATPILLTQKTMRLAANMLPKTGRKRVKIEQTEDETRVESVLMATTYKTPSIGPRGRKKVKTTEEVGGQSLRIKDAKDRAGVFPDWRSIMPAADAKGVFISFDPHYLIAALQALVPQTTVEYSTVTMFIQDKDSPILAWAKDGSSALVMPIDADAGQHDLTACSIARPAAVIPAKPPRKRKAAHATTETRK